MNRIPQKTITKSKKLIFVCINLLLFLLLFFFAGEIFVRLKGYQPFIKKKPNITVVPGGKLFQPDSELGYRFLPGKFKITIENQLTFETTHREDTFRITHPEEDNPEYESKEKIWILGCSVTHGWCLNDFETYPWLVQEMMPEYEILNFGVGGYGTIHSLMILESGLKKYAKPRLVILTYASFHDTRNTFSNARRRTVAAWNFLGPVSQPYASLDQKGNLVFHKVEEVVYRTWPLARQSALINYFEKRRVATEIPKIPHIEVSKALVEKIHKICQKENIPLVVAGIKDNAGKLRRMMGFCESLNIPFVDITVDLNLKEHTFLPIDAHPSALANQKYADKLFQFLKQNQLPDPLPENIRDSREGHETSH